MADKSNMSPDELKKTSGGTSADRARPKIQPVDPNTGGGGSSDTMNDADMAGARGGQGVRATVSGVQSGGKVDPYGSNASTDPLSDRDLRRSTGGAGAVDTGVSVSGTQSGGKLDPRELKRASGGASADTGVSLSGATSGGKIDPHGQGGPTDPLNERELRRASGGTQNADARRLKADKPASGNTTADTRGIEPR